MAAVESESTHGRGKLLSLEGDIDTISTQLRLLPPSQKILVLPSLVESLDQIPKEQSFDAKTFIRNVHTAFTARTENARSFLEPSTSAHPRLVFMNGGSVRARTLCIEKIAENVTNGNAVEAETIFNEVVKDGVAGLIKQEEATANETVEESQSQVDGADEEEGKEQDRAEHREVDPSVQAMKAVETLDQETAALQAEEEAEGITQSPYDNADQNETVETDDRKLEDSPHFKEETSEDGQKTPTNEQPNAIFTSPEGKDIVRTVVSVPARETTRQQKRSTFDNGYPPETPFTARTYYSEALSHQAEEAEDDFDEDLISPGDNSFVSVPPTPGVVYGEACIVDMLSAAPSEKPLMKRIKSLDEFYSRYQDPSVSPKTVKHSKSAYHLGQRPMTAGLSFPTLPRTTFVRASQTPIKRSPPSSVSRKWSRSSLVKESLRVFVDRGTDAEKIEVEEDIPEEEEAEPFEPVFAVVEDLVIHFVDEKPNEIFESIIRSYKTGGYPVFPPSAPAEETEEPETGATPSPVSSMSNDDHIRPTSHLTAETDDVGYERRHNYDPYAPHNSYPEIKIQWPPPDKFGRADSAMQATEPSTPTITPPPSSEIAQKFLDFSPMNSGNAVSVQNSLRQVLNVHFQAGENGYSQYYRSVSPEMDRLWKPVFRNDESASIGNEGRTVDQIIALGCEDGVKKDFFAQVSGQIERLGTKKDGVSRSGKLDIRYLISNVILQYSNLPLATQSSSNPLSNPTLLAALLVPQIESYLASNTTTPLLILHYPSAHLATVLALRKLLGVDLLKIAGILDTLSYDPPSLASRSKTPTSKPPNPLSNDTVSSRSHGRLNSLQQTREDLSNTLQRQTSVTSSTALAARRTSTTGVSFSKANYLLPSTATDAEITTFLGNIWKSLVEKSAFYTPEPEPKPIIIQKPPLPPTPANSLPTSRGGDRDRDSGYPPSSFRPLRNDRDRESKISRLTRNSNIRSHGRAASITSTIKTTASERVRREDREWENFYIGEEDSDDDAYDRMILGRGFAKIVPEVKKPGQKRNTKKALKWLGLA